MRMKVLLGLSLFLVILGSVQAIGVTYPLPSELELLRGESGRFWFQIQNVAGTGNQFCKYSIEDLGLSYAFDNPNGIEILEGMMFDVYGTINVNSNDEIKLYQGKVRVECSPETKTEGTGASVVKTLSVPIKVNIVEIRTHENMIIPDKPNPYLDFLNKYHLHIFSICCIIVMISISYYYLVKKRSKNEVNNN